MAVRPYSSRVLGDRFDEWAARNRRPILVVGGWAVVVLVASTVALVIGGEWPPWAWYGLGLLHAGVVGAFVFTLQSVFVATDGKAIWHVRGAWGEDNTRETLRKAQRGKLIWGWVDSVNLQRGDLDHLVVSRSGGVVVIDSKWRNQITDHAEIIEAAKRAATRSDGVMRTLLKAERGGHRAKGNSIRVTPLVVIWGAAQAEVPEVVRADGVEVVSGQGLLAWLGQRDEDPVNEDVARDLIRRLEVYRDQLADSR